VSRITVGLTGGLASGKSTVAGWLREAGYRVVDADRLVADLYAAGGVGAAAVRDLFGDEVLREDGSVDHQAVAARVFEDEEALERLEAAIHPLVRERFAEIAASTDGVAVLEATLLVEAGYAPDFDLVVSVEGDPEVRLERAVARGLDREAAKARLIAQGDGRQRRAGAHLLIDNDRGLDQLRDRVDELIEEIQSRRGQA
jgi:dephospho-CoA kinase